MKALTLRTDEKTWAKVMEHFGAYSNQEAFNGMLEIIKAKIHIRKLQEDLNARVNARREKDLAKMLKKKSKVKKGDSQS